MNKFLFSPLGLHYLCSMLERNYQAFFALMRAGLWESRKLGVGIESTVDWGEVYRVANEQAVMGLIAAGMEQVQEGLVTKAEALKFAGYALQLEQRNRAMNEFVASLIDKLRGQGVNPVLVKGQGIAQCYERPLWRACGDVDLLINPKEYDKAKELLTRLSSSAEEEDPIKLHIGYKVGLWEVELHGTLRTVIGRRIDRVVDAAQTDTFNNEHFRAWENGKTQVLIPSPDNDVIFIFSHILQHFYKGGVGLRQACDWCRLLWCYRSEVNLHKLESRIRAMHIMGEWRAFTALAVDWLGMSADTIPFYSPSRRWSRKARRIMNMILKTGNFGHNADTSYQQKRPYLIRKTISLWRHTSSTANLFFIFPGASLRTWFLMLGTGLHRVAQGR